MRKVDHLSNCLRALYIYFFVNYLYIFFLSFCYFIFYEYFNGYLLTYGYIYLLFYVRNCSFFPCLFVFGFLKLPFIMSFFIIMNANYKSSNVLFWEHMSCHTKQTILNLRSFNNSIALFSNTVIDYLLSFNICSIMNLCILKLITLFLHFSDSFQVVQTFY